MSDRLIVDWPGLQRMGWPLGRTQTWRKMQPTITVSRKIPGQKRRVAQEIPNPDPFPACHKLGPFVNSHPVWRVADVLAYFERQGLQVTADWQTP
jgi:hypothetical protein